MMTTARIELLLHVPPVCVYYCYLASIRHPIVTFLISDSAFQLNNGEPAFITEGGDWPTVRIICSTIFCMLHYCSEENSC